MSRPAKTSPRRRADLERAIKATKRGQSITLQELSELWGVSKGRFCNIRDSIVGMPDHVQGSHNQVFYPRLRTLKALLAHETRNDGVIAARSAKLSRLMGGDATRDDGPAFPPSELLKLDQLAANLEARAIAQRRLVRADDVSQRAAKIFSLLSSRLGNLDTLIDPNGKLDADLRARVREAGRGLLLRMHADLKDMLAVDVDDEPDRAPPPRKRARAA